MLNKFFFLSLLALFTAPQDTRADSVQVALSESFGHSDFGQVWDKEKWLDVRVNFVDYSPDGSLQAIASSDGTLKILEVSSDKLLRTIFHTNAVFSVSFSADGQFVATAAQDTYARVFRVSTGELVQKIYAGNNVVSVDFSPIANELAVARAWDLQFTDRRICYPRGGTHSCYPRADDYEANFLEVSVYILPSGQETRRKFSKYVRGILSNTTYAGRMPKIFYSSNGKLIGAISSFYPASLFDAADGTDLTTKAFGENARVTSVVFSPDSKKVMAELLTGYLNDLKLLIIDAATLDVSTRAEVSVGVMSSSVRKSIFATFLHDSDLIAFNKMDDTSHFRVYDVKGKKSVFALTKGNRVEGEVAVSPDGAKVASIENCEYRDCFSNLRVYDIQGQKELLKLETAGKFEAVRFSPDGEQVVVWGQGGLRTLNLRAEKFAAFDSGNAADVVQFSPDQKKLAVASHDRTIKLIDLTKRKVIHHLDLALSAAMIQFSPDGEQLLIGGNDGKLQTMNTTEGSVRLIAQFDGPIQTVQFSKDSQRILVATSKYVKVLSGVGDVSLSFNNERPYGYDYNFESALWSADENGIVIVKANEDRKRFPGSYDAVNGRQLAEFDSHHWGNQLVSLGITADPRRFLVMTGMHLKLMDYSDRDPIFSLWLGRCNGYTCGLKKQVQSVDGTSVGVLTKDGRVFFTNAFATKKFLVNTDGSVGKANFSSAVYYEWERPYSQTKISQIGAHPYLINMSSTGKILVVASWLSRLENGSSVTSHEFAKSELTLLRPSTGAVIARLSQPAKIFSAAVSKSESLVATVSTDGLARVYNAKGKLLQKIKYK